MKCKKGNIVGLGITSSSSDESYLGFLKNLLKNRKGSIDVKILFLIAILILIFLIVLV